MENAGWGRVLVTGGTGLVGSHVVELLLSSGYQVMCLVRDRNRLQWLSGLKVDLVQGDCTDPASLVPAVRGAAAIVHCAGLTKAKRAGEYYLVNQVGTRNILHACARQKTGIRKFVLISSLAAAGPSLDGIPVRATDVPRPVSDYGKSKLKAEEEALAYRDEFPVVILRPSAVYGPRDRDMYELFRWASRGITLEITGGERYLNFCFVKDLATAVLKALKANVPSGALYFVAENRQYSWTDFRTALLAAGGVKAVKVKIPYAAAYLLGLLSEAGSIFTGRPALTSRQKVLEASQQYWISDLSRNREELGFTTAYSLQEGLQITWQWYREHNWLS